MNDRSDQVDRVEQLLDLDPARVAVLLVDFQRDFCGPGEPGPGTVGNARAAVRANEFAAHAARLGVRVIYSQQVLDPDRLTSRQRRWETDGGLCAAGTTGAELFVPPVPGAKVVRKDRFDVWQSREFLDVLDEWDIDGLVVTGVELQCCVLFAALGADERGFHYVVPQDLVSGIDGCDETSNRVVRDYFRFAHPSVESAQDLLTGWHRRRPAEELRTLDDLGPYRGHS
ncbi:MAG TPA: isochorismatase family cysteine hydrolase [Actinoplanes sp.]|jgi:nicotinamidase-related amidase